LGGRPFHRPVIRPVIHPVIHPSKFLIAEEEDDGRGGGGTAAAAVYPNVYVFREGLSSFSKLQTCI
jgi:hypothetical protein